jgi:GTP cyclohydrolase I
VIVESRELIVVRGLRFASRCEAHELPVVGVVHVGYVPDGHLLDVEDLADAIEARATLPQRQEQLTAAVSDWLEEHVAPVGTAVVLEADHACYAGRDTNVVTTRFRGALQHEPTLRAEFLSSLRR